jgi:phytoene desaturase
MPDVFDRFFFGKRQPIIMSSSSYLLLIVYFGVDEFITIADNLAEIEATFESIEEGSGAVLHKFITEARATDIAIKDLVYRPGVSPLELVTVETTKKIGQFFISRDVHKV